MYYRIETGNLTLQLKVSAGASTSEFKQLKTEEYAEIRIAAIRDKGKANDELVAYLSSIFKVPKSHIEIISGATAPHKRVRIRTNTPQAVLEILQSAIGAKTSQTKNTKS